MRRALPSFFALLLLSVACASSPAPQVSRAQVERVPVSRAQAPSAAGSVVVNEAVKMLGAPYRFGGATPRGFDCSGLVIYSYDKAGYPGLPHSTSDLAEIARPVAMDELAPGDLMIFELAGKKASHVGIYMGDRKFIHAPSSGGRVEIVDFDHVYWGRHLGKAGRLLSPTSSVALVH